MTIGGSCLCGGVRYAIDGSLGTVVNCHCSMCRKATGAAFRTRASVPAKAFCWLSGQELVSRYESSAGEQRTFCRVCGSTLPTFFRDRPNEIGVPLGTLDDDPKVRPSAHVFVGSKAPWWEITDSLPQYREASPQGSVEDAVAFARIAERIVPGATLLSHCPLRGGVSAAVYALEVTSADGPLSFVLRRHGAATWKQLPDTVTRTEFQLLRVVREAGLPVPRPVLFDDSATLLPSPFFVMELVEGSTDISSAWLDAALGQMAEFLARLHALDAANVGLSQLPAREDPVQGTLQYLPSEPRFARLREVIASYRVQPSRPALLHGDFWPGNLLWREQQLTAVLDWEDAALGPAASDVACCRAELNAAFDATAARVFTERYLAASADQLSDLALWDLYVGSAALATLHAWGLPAEIEARRRERTSEFVNRAAAALLLAST